MVGRNVLLALMGRIRRRRRFIAAVQGAAAAVALAGPILAVAAVILRRTVGAAVDADLLVIALTAVACVGAVVRAGRRISLQSCARSVDQALGKERSHDRVLAAIALIETSPTPTPFVAAVIEDAVARASGVPPRRAVPPPSVRSLASALAAVAVVLLASLLPNARLSASDEGTIRARAAIQPKRAAIPIRLSALSLESEREDARLAATVARAAADPELAGLAREFEQMLSDLSTAGLDAGGAVSRLAILEADAQAAASWSRISKAAAQAGAKVLEAARGVGTDGAALAAQIAAAQEATDATTDAAGHAAERLAARGANGAAAVTNAAKAATAALAGGGAGSRGGPGAGAGAGAASNAGEGSATNEGNPGGEGAEHRRRLDSASESAPEAAYSAGGRGTNQHQRRLERLRRDLAQDGTDCRGDPASCRKNADRVGRALTDLHRLGRTAEARQRLAEAIRQLLDRVRRGDAVGGERGQLRRFARAARGAERGSVRPGAGDANTEDPSKPGDPGAVGGAAPIDDAAADDGDGDSESTASGEGGDDRQTDGSSAQGGHTARATGGGAETAAAATPAGGIGSAPGGPVLGVRTPGGAPTGHDAPAQVRDDPAGPSRATVIGAAAARGFASADYQKVFVDYRAAVEESMDATVVPPGRRYLVRRYFQLIRPRTP